jgi:(2S)-methylsuccinyl-CoA dehydrogenase
MPLAAPSLAAGFDLVTMAREATAAVEALLADASAKVRERVTIEGRVVGRLFDREQRAAHGLAWFATYVEAVRQLTAYAERMQSTKRLTEIEELLIRIGLGEYLAQILGGIPISQGEIVRPADLGLSGAAVAARQYGAAPGEARRTDARQPYRHGRRLRPRRHAGDDPR